MRARYLLGGIAGAATMIAALTVISRMLGFGRWLVQSATVQASATGTAYGAANLVPNVLYEVVAGGALAGAVIPVLAAPIARRLRDEVNQTASALLTWAVLALTPVALALGLFARQIATVLPIPRGADGDVQVELVTYFLIIFAPQVLLYGIGVVLTGILQAHKRFLAPALAPILSTLMVIVTYLAFGYLADGLQDSPGQISDGALAVLAWGTTAGVAVMALPLLIPVWRCGVRVRPALRFPPGVARRARALALAGVGALLAQQTSVLVVMWLALDAGVDGTINLYQWSQAVYWLPYAVLVVPLATAVYPRLAELASHHDSAPFARMAETSTRAVLAVSFTGVAGLAAAAPAVAQVFATWNDTTGMSQALTWMAPGVVGLSLIFHVTRVLYAMERSRAALAATSLGWLVVCLACIVGVLSLAPDGGDGPATLVALGAGHSVGMVVAAVALLWTFARLVHRPVLGAIGRSVAVAGIGTVLGGMLGRFATDTVLSLAGQSAIAAIMAGLLGAVVSMGLVAVAVTLGDRSTIDVFRRVRG